MSVLDNYVESKLEAIEEANQMEKDLLKENERASRARKLTTYEHTGFDFDQAAGHDILITDKLSKRFEKAIFEHLGRNVFADQLSNSLASSRMGSLNRRKESV